MNDFHILNICIQNKDVAGAMRVLREKSEFAVRKILEKLKVRVTTQTGRTFWHYVQGWLLSARLCLTPFCGIKNADNCQSRGCSNWPNDC